MEINNIKCVMIFDESLPVGVIANTAAIMGASLGKADHDVVGIDRKSTRLNSSHPSSSRMPSSA